MFAHSIFQNNLRRNHALHNTIEHFLNHAVGFDHAPASVAVNITETDSAFLLHLAAPGYQKEQFSIKTEPKHLFVAAKLLPQVNADATATDTDASTEPTPATVQTATPKEKWLRHEFSTNGFERKFQLPDNINVTAIVAHYENGILTVTLPKRTNDAALHREVNVL